MMDRRDFIAKAGGAAVASSFSAYAGGMTPAASAFAGRSAVGGRRTDANRNRFGVNYTPSRDWWFCWNDWKTDPIERDLDAIAALGADHMRIMLIWPYFQPNRTWVSPVHLDRLDELLTLMGKRNLDAVVTVFTGQLSGLFFLPPFHRLEPLSTYKPDPGFYIDPEMWGAQEMFIRQLAGRMKAHENFIGFDFGNELDTCWRTEPAIGDVWMAKMFSLMESVSPEGLHINGVAHEPWFESNTFSPQALAARPFPSMHCYPYWTGAGKYGGPMDPPSIKLLAAMATLIRSYAGGARKPVWAEEFNTCIEALTQKEEAEWLEKAVHAAMDAGVSWFTYWDSHDVDRKFEFNSLEYSLGILTNDGKVKEQGRMFKQLADSYRGKPVVVPTQSVPPPPVNRSNDVTWKWMLDWMEWKPKS